MLFNSLIYLIFFSVAFILYWLIDYFVRRKHSSATLVQNIFLLIASYVFYAWWDWKFLFLLIGMSVISWLCAQLIQKQKMYNLAPSAMEREQSSLRSAHRAKVLMWGAIIIDLGILGFFKYYNFFVASFCNLFHLNASHSTLNHILPLGISFFTFQAISYVVDAYHGRLPRPIPNPSLTGQGELNNFINCLLYIGFFPKLLAGPIERPSYLIPQIQQRRVFTYELGTDGLRQILWGLFKKVVVADNCATYVNAVYGDIAHQSGSTLLLAAILYTIQIYGDFSGYSDMAIGSAKLLGFKFRDNFLFPYFSRNMNEFWRRWHISLNTWFVDYVYIPLGGSRNGKARTIANTMIIFLLSGLWHGADWSFVAWGGYHGLLLVILILLGHNTKYDNVVAYDRWYPNVKEIGQMLLTFALATIGWMMFRADNISVFMEYGIRILSPSLLSIPWLMTRAFYIPLAAYIAVMMVVDWIYRKDATKILTIPCRYHWVHWLIYYALIIVCYYGAPSETIQFIYQQF